MERKVFLSQYLIWLMLLMGQLHGYKSCIQKERNALLELKEYLISIKSEELSLDYVLLPTWTNDSKSDCCRWEEIKCDRTSGRVTEVAFHLHLKESSLLNLSLLHPFEEVRSLDLSGLGFIGLFDDLEGYHSLKRLRNLEILDLSSNNFNTSIFPFLNAATTLTTLFLRDNHMNGPFPPKGLRDLTNLELLDLSRCSLNGNIPLELSAMRNLKVLSASGNEFSGTMGLQVICKLKKLEELDLSQNKLGGEFPVCLTSLTGLKVLDLSSNQLTGKLPSTLGNLESFEYLSLVYNDFEGFFSLGWLANLTELKVFKLDSNLNSLQVESESSWKPKFQLSVIVLPSCNLEKVPHFLQHQNDLRYVDLSENKMIGSFPSWLLENNTKLEALLLQNNLLTSFQLPESVHNHLLFLNVSVNKFNHGLPEKVGWILPRLQYMNFANNGFQGNLPSSLGNMEEIEFLDISHNSFSGNLPTSFVKGCHSLGILKLSHNKLSGEIFRESPNFTGVVALSMENNKFSGFGQGLRSLKYLMMLDISNNSLEGEIPISLFNLSTLWILDLSANNLSGNIPPRINSGIPVVLLLQDNNLSGVIPDTLLLGHVRILDLSNNRLSGNIPEFINTQDISMLLLRGNSFTSGIPRQLCGLRNIHLLDLANNRVNGSIPSCLSNTSFGLGDADTSSSYDVDILVTPQLGPYFESLLVQEQNRIVYIAGIQTKVEFATKHRYDAYLGENLGLLFGMDLSGNELSGEIPSELGGLLQLQALNLSHNHLSGTIPETFSGLKNVESLDLSFNTLQGRIPPQLTELSSLAIFNVSYNNLSGIIPQGRQFNTFDTKSYFANPLLCGDQINISCNSNNFQESDNGVEPDEPTVDMVSFYWSFAAAFVTILLGIFASLSFDSPWSRAWFYTVDVFIHKVRNLLG